MKKKIYIEGMTCEHCVKHVKEALGEVAGVISTEVNLAEKYAFIETDTEVQDEEIKNAIEEIDYSVTRIENL